MSVSKALFAKPLYKNWEKSTSVYAKLFLDQTQFRAGIIKVTIVLLTAGIRRGNQVANS